MSDSDEDLLADLLLRWEELRELGQDVSATELCQDHPDLIAELVRRIAVMRATSWMDKPIDPGGGVVAPEDLAPNNPGTLLGRYRLDNLIAEGGFAQVWRGYDLELQRTIAVKLPKPGRLQSADAFMAEARRVARLKHPGIVPVHDIGIENELCFIVSEYVEGGSLADRLAKNPPSQPQAVQWVVEIAEALEYAHLHGIIHRDIKPGNILIDHLNRALLADFGIAQSVSMVGKDSLSLGTLAYMPPEQLEDRGLDHRSDIFSLGIVLYESLTGRLPYSSSDPNVLRREIAGGITNLSDPDLSSALKKVCNKVLDRDPHQRYTSAADFAADLQRSLGAKRSNLPWIILSLAGAFGIITVWIGNAAFSPRGPILPKSSVMRAAAEGQKSKAEATAYWLNTFSGVRHNQRCEHYKKTKQGRPCGPKEGKPCGICGG